MTSKPSCPLCRGEQSAIIDRVDGEWLWDKLEAEFNAGFSKAERKKYCPQGEWTLHQCADCSLQYFSPMQPGDGEFYGRLSLGGKYYAGDKWDFLAAFGHMSKDGEGLDVACGEGRFLELAAERGVRFSGIDTNSQAIDIATGKGLDASCLSLGEYAAKLQGSFDTVTLFQIVEHVPDPVELVTGAASLLKPGGCLIITVPNRDRRIRQSGREPLDCPPHHMSRWSGDTLSQLALAAGMQCRQIIYEVADMHECRRFLREALFRNPGSLLARLTGLVVWNPVTYKVSKTLKLLDRLKYWRMSMLAVFVRSP